MHEVHNPSMHLTLFVPNLIWPDQDNPLAFQFENAQSLSRFFHCSEYTNSLLDSDTSWESVLAEIFGYHKSHAPLAALRLLGETPQADFYHPEGNRIICADPVHLEFVQQALITSSFEKADISLQEAKSVIKTLNEEFSNEGEFFFNESTNRWYFFSSDNCYSIPNLASCSRFIGRRIDVEESRRTLGTEGLHWLNRIQICLNNHPVNETRLQNGHPTINSIWPWGISLPEETLEKNNTPFTQAIGNDTLLNGLCMATKTRIADQWETNTGCSLIVDTSATNAIEKDDLVGWQHAVDSLTYRYIQPALAKLINQEMTTLTVISPSSQKTHYWKLSSDSKILKPSLVKRILSKAYQPIDLATAVRKW